MLFRSGRGDVGLQVGKAEHAIRFQRQDLVDLGAEERTDARLFFARPAGSHGVTRNAHNAMLLPEHIQPLGGFFGQADDALWAHELKINSNASRKSASQRVITVNRRVISIGQIIDSSKPCGGLIDGSRN